MAFGSLEIASIPRTQDYSVMKQNEDNKGAFQQMTLGQQSQNRVKSLRKKYPAVIMRTGIPDNMMPRRRDTMNMPETAEINAGKRKNRKMVSLSKNSIVVLTSRSENTKET